MSKEKKKMPSIFKMATNFAKDLCKYIKEGAPNVTNKQYVKRLETCNQCPHLDKERMRCGLCGCLMEHKAKWKTTTCPDKPGRWEILYQPPGTPSEDKRSALQANKILKKAYKEGLWDPKKPHTAKPLLKAMGYGSVKIKKDYDGRNKKSGTKEGGKKTK